MGKEKSLIKDLKEFKLKTSEHIPIKKMIFFGSRVTGKPHRWSDIDLIIVSTKFGHLNFRKRATKMYDYWNLNFPVDFLCYTPEEFDRFKKQVSIVRDALRDGIEI